MIFAIVMKKFLFKWIGAAVTAMALTFPAASAQPCSAEVLKERIIEMELAPTRLAQKTRTRLNIPACYPVDEAPVVTPNDLVRIGKLIGKDGRFGDIDYANTDRSEWKVLKHLDYCRMLAIALKCYPPDTLRKTRARENCLLALDWWLAETPKNSNWWSNDVYVAQMLGNIGLLLDEETLGPERLGRLRELTKNATPGRTGQNMMWLSWNSLLAGILAGDDARTDKALRILEDTIALAQPGKEGIQADLSFHQHGPQLYQGNYGRHYLHSASKYLRAVQGTDREDKAKTQLIERLLLDGTRWMCWKGLLDYSAWGRQITYNDRFQGPDLIYVCDHMLTCSTERRADIAEFSDLILTSFYPDSMFSNSLCGTRAFPLSDYIVHRPASFLTTLRMSSTRTVIGEITNGDNLKGSYLSDGAMLTYGFGHEYKMIFPCWDWTCIPGTTAARGHLPKNWSGKRGSSPFAGAMDQGVAAMSVDHFGIKAHKSWFFLKDRIVCLGSDIRGSIDKLPVMTTIEQCHQIPGQPRRLQGRKANGVYHCSSLYLIDASLKTILETGKRTGSWKSIRKSSDDREVSTTVFLLAIDHGIKPEKASYAYQVFPFMLEENLSVDRLWSEVTILSHDDKVHAIAAQNAIHAVFFTPSTLQLPDKRSMTATEPCLVTLSAGDALHVHIPGKYEGNTTIILDGNQKTVAIENPSRVP